MRSVPRVWMEPIRLASYISRKKNYYQVLGVPTDATKEQIKLAFVEKTNELHPDRGHQPIQDSRIGWSRANSTEKFMLVKEAYDCLRNGERRRAYDEEILLTTGGGFLMEATSCRFKDTVIDLNKRRNENYTGPGRTRGESAAHFRDPEQEYYAEKRKNRTLYLIGGLFLSVIGLNLLYVSYLHRSGRKRLILNP